MKTVIMMIFILLCVPSFAYDVVTFQGDIAGAIRERNEIARESLELEKKRQKQEQAKQRKLAREDAYQQREENMRKTTCKLYGRQCD